MSLSFTPYATDEDIAVRCPGDYKVLCPAWQSLAGGTDGVFAAGLPWVLTSITADFLALGVKAGSVVLLSGPKANFPGGGLLYAVDSVASSAASLRAVGLGLHIGKPPGPAAGLTGVTFSVPTLIPQIEQACLEANHAFGIDPNVAIKNPALVYDPARELTQFVVLTVLQRQYATETRTDRGDFALKLQQVERDLAGVRARMVVKWGTLGEGEASRSPFSTQVRR